MKILIVTPFLPYKNAPHAGGILVYESIKMLSKDHEVCLLSRLEPSENQYLDDAKQYCKEVHIYQFKTPSSRNPIPIVLSYIILGLKANRLIKDGSFNMVQIEYTEAGLAFKRPTIPSFLVAHDVIVKPAMRRYEASSSFLQKVVNSFKLTAVRWVERFISRKFDAVFTMSRVDRDALLSLDDALHVEVSPNLIGLEFNDEVVVYREPASLLFVGAMQRDLNVDAALYFYQKVFPIIRREIPGVKFYVVGGNPPEMLRKLADDDPNMIVTGFVEDLRKYLYSATVFVSPILIGGGIIVKNLQAMSCAIPVVTTSIGNEGIMAVPGRDLFVADEPGEFAVRVLELLKDSKLQKRVGESGRAFAQKEFSDNNLFARRMAIYNQVIKEF